MSKARGFVAYPGIPPMLGQTVSRAVQLVGDELELSTWQENEIAGRPLIDPIFQNINSSDFLVGDISILNFNVTYEIGYGIGKNRRVFLIKNAAIQSNDDQIRRIGIFDTLGYELYENAEQLANFLRSRSDFRPLKTDYPEDHKTPVYVLGTPRRTDAMGRIIARVKRARLQYRSFDPSEENRLSAPEAIRSISSACGVIVPLLDPGMEQAEIHNIRAAFVAGLAHGLGKSTLILQPGDAPVPLDVRDFVSSYNHPNDIDDYISLFALDVVDALQASSPIEVKRGTLLGELNIGSSIAENEFRTLGEYFLQTDEFARSLRAEINLVIGRKGSGKTALFFQIRDNLRDNKANIVVDLKPEGYQLIKMKEQVLDYLEHGSQLHLVTAFWEYLLLLEIARKLLEKDAKVHLRNHNLYEPYLGLKAVYEGRDIPTEGDFSERMMDLSEKISSVYESKFGSSRKDRLSNDDITEILHLEDLPRLREIVFNYLSFKNETWVLFDNLDKSWATGGIEPSDLIIIAGLLDARRKIERDMDRTNLTFHMVVFLRNDVYRVLVQQMADRGKEIRADLDWRDEDLIRELIKRRLVYNNMPEDADFDQLWRQVCVSHIDGEESFQYLIDRCLMRPRYLLNLINHCRGFAVNFGHEKISESDIAKGMMAYSNDLIVDTNHEIEDVFPNATRVIYAFLEASADLTGEEIRDRLATQGISDTEVERTVELLLWYGFLGISRSDGQVTYIHSIGYDIDKLNAIIAREYRESITYRVNPAFWPGLDIGQPVAA